MWKRRQSEFIVLAILSAGVFGACDVLRDSDTADDLQPTTSGMVPTATPAQTVEIPDHTQAIEHLRSVSPPLADAVAAIEAGDVGALESTMGWRSIICGQGGEFSPSCEQLGLPEGTSIDVIHEAMGQFLAVTWGFDRPRDATLAQFEELLAGGASLDLIATDGDGSFVLGFEFATPQAAPPDLPGITYDRLLLHADAEQDRPIHAYSFGLSSSRPFDSARSEEQAGRPYQVWWMSESLTEREDGAHETATGG